jgi:pimeloyl-ACP methyl ester carboxylesterase
MIVRDNELDTMKAARLQRLQKVLPARAALAVGQLNRKHLAAAFPVDADRDQHRLARNNPVIPHLLIAGVQDQIGKRFLQPALAERLQRCIQPLVDRADRRGREAMADLLAARVQRLPSGSCGTFLAFMYF